MRCLVKAGKHTRNTWAITRQLLNKWVPTAMNMHAAAKAFWTITMESVFSVWFVQKCYKQGQSSSGVSYQQFS
jgi:hypothetical protein